MFLEDRCKLKTCADSVFPQNIDKVMATLHMSETCRLISPLWEFSLQYTRRVDRLPHHSLIVSLYCGDITFKIIHTWNYVIPFNFTRKKLQLSIISPEKPIFCSNIWSSNWFNSLSSYSNWKSYHDTIEING